LDENRGAAGIPLFAQHGISLLITFVLVIAGAAGLIAPFLVDSHHWWLRKSKKK
jgi:hypothetical protein